jgi:hypothetical protein
MENAMKDLYDVFRKIQKLPIAHLGCRESIYDLQSFYLGCIFARKEMGLPITAQEEEFSMFEAWLQEKLNVETMMPWGHMVCFRSMNEYQALNRFFELLEEFQHRADTTESEPMCD